MAVPSYLVGHLHKKGSAPQYRGLGSIDIYAAARSVMTVGKLLEDETTLVIVHNKSNLSVPGASQAFGIDDGCGFWWLGECGAMVDELMGGKPKQKIQIAKRSG